jgi:hypothetical protein
MTPVAIPEDHRHAPKPDPMRSEIRAPETDCQAASAAAYAFDFEGVVRRALESSMSIDAPRQRAASPTAVPTSAGAVRSPRRSVRAGLWAHFLSFRRSG